MKSYEEMTNNVLRRIDEYEAKKERQKSVAKKVATGLSCVCLAAIIGIGAAHYDNMTSHKPLSEIQASITKADKFTDSIIINRVSEISSERRKLNFDLSQEDFVSMNKQQLNEYYAIPVFPAVPSDLKEWDEDNYGIYKRNGGKGEVYFDMTILNYANKDFSRSINLELQKGSLPPSCYAFFEEIKNESVINNVKIKIAQNESGYYYASFMYQNVGFRIIGEGLTQDEFICVLSSLTNRAK